MIFEQAYAKHLYKIYCEREDDDDEDDDDRDDDEKKQDEEDEEVLLMKHDAKLFGLYS